MYELAQNYRSTLVRDALKVERMGDLEQILQVAEDLMEKREIQVEVDKELGEWNEEWRQGTQSEEAKWLEIEYITEEIDYHYGINLAYYYANQQSNPEQRKVIMQQISELKQRLAKEKEIDFQELGIDPNEQPKSRAEEDEDSDENLFEDVEIQP
jgi:hypothetical protein